MGARAGDGTTEKAEGAIRQGRRERGLLRDDGADEGSAGGWAEPVRSVMLADQVKDQLLTRILAGELVPGERVVETRVARELGISQGPVREALRDLATLGLVDLEPYRGARVRRPSTAEFREAMRVRAELEVMAAEEACPRVTAGDLADLREMVGRMLAEVAAGDLKAYVRHNTEFHRAVLQLSGNRTLARLWELLEPFARTYITAMAAPVDPGWVRRSHLKIVRALASGDPAAAAAAARDHSRDTQSQVGRRDDDAAGRTAARGGARTGGSQAGRRIR